MLHSVANDLHHFLHVVPLQLQTVVDVHGVHSSSAHSSSVTLPHPGQDHRAVRPFQAAGCLAAEGVVLRHHYYHLPGLVAPRGIQLSPYSLRAHTREHEQSVLRHVCTALRLPLSRLHTKSIPTDSAEPTLWASSAAC